MRKIAVIGAGRVGISFAFLLEKQGYEIAAVASRTKASLTRAQKYLKAGLFTLQNSKATKLGEVVLVSTSDEAVAPVVKELAKSGGFRPGQFVFHLSGTLSLKVLQPAKEAGALIGSIHPLQTFSNVVTEAEKLKGVIFGVTAEGEAKEVAEELVRALGGEPVEVRGEDKVLYHAAAVIACNYLYTLIYAAIKVYGKVGFEKEKAWESIKPLAQRTLENVDTCGVVAALTGPIARGDVETVKMHLAALEKNFPEVLPLYRELGKLTAQIAKEKGLSLEMYQKLLDALS
jgi:predicted short-subunit dehydrogenase-like oxidoreductase (DUF2520 family)